MFWIPPYCLIEVVDCTCATAEASFDSTTIDIYIGIFRTDRDCHIIISKCFLVMTKGSPSNASAIVGFEIMWVDTERFLKIC